MQILREACEQLLERLHAIKDPDGITKELRAECERRLAIFAGWNENPPGAGEVARVHAESFTFYRRAILYLDGKGV
jgi:hypothetical protein